MTSNEFQKLLDRYSRGECTPEEEAFVTNWYNAIDNEQRKDVPEEIAVVVQAKAWAKLKRGVDNNKKSTPPLGMFFRIAAAVALLILAGAALMLVLQQYHVLQGAENVASAEEWIVWGSTCDTPCPVTLSDGTRVVLQPGSEIRYPAQFKGNKRELYLTGEAFFDVHRDTLRPFLVYANEVVTRVLGTSFTVTAYTGARDITVAVKTGKVSVYKQTASAQNEAVTDAVILVPNQQAVYSREQQQVIKALVSHPHIILEKPTLFAMEYDGTPVVKILQVLEENYGIDIVFDEKMLEGCTLTTSMADEGLYERIRIICEAIGARYEMKETTIVITSDGCRQ